MIQIVIYKRYIYPTRIFKTRFFFQSASVHIFLNKCNVGSSLKYNSSIHETYYYYL